MISNVSITYTKGGKNIQYRLFWCGYCKKLAIFCFTTFINNVWTFADPNEFITVSHTLEPNMSTGSYNFTVYFALPRRDPLLLATILSFMFTDFKRGLPSVEVHPTENQVCIKHI